MTAQRAGVRRPGAAPLVIAIMSSRATADARHDERLLADAAGYVARTLA
jgi:beta-lactamase class A